MPTNLAARGPLEGAYMIGASLRESRLDGANLRDTCLLGADLSEANLANSFAENADLRGVRAQGSDLSGAWLLGARLSGVELDANTNLLDTHLASAYLCDIKWNGANLGMADINGLCAVEVGEEGLARARDTLARTARIRQWTRHIPWLGTHEAHRYQRLMQERPNRYILEGLHEAYRWEFAGLRPQQFDSRRPAEAAVRTHTQLAGELLSRGFTVSADVFSYRARRSELRLRPRHSLRRGFHRSLGWLCGWGFRPGRTVFAWLLTNALFTGAYVARVPMWHNWAGLAQAVVLSITAFHGRGLAALPSADTSDLTIGALSATEAVIGLVIEASFVSTFVRRFLNG
jgi:uncharacterized protein YjbI with pentapeptide repeats